MRRLIDKVIKILFRVKTLMTPSPVWVSSSDIDRIVKHGDISLTKFDSCGPWLEKIIGHIDAYIEDLLSGIHRFSMSSIH